MDNSVREFIRNYVNAILDKNAAIFAGAGLSVQSGFVNWKDLMRDIALDLGLDVDKESDLIAIAQYHVNDRLGNRSVINQTIINHFTKKVDITENHRLLSKLPIATYWTTNYDELIERSLEEEGKTVDVKRISENLFIKLSKRDAVVYKMHGDITIPNQAVITKEDYETYEAKRMAYSITLQADLLSKTFLFVGFSFEDPNLISVLSRIKNLLGSENTNPHYCIFKRVSKSGNSQKLRKQNLMLKDLARYSIRSILIDDYREITQIIENISSLYKRSQIFVSGAAEVFDEFGSELRAKELIHELSKSLVSNDKKIISGFGYNVGSGIINGALDYIFSTKYRKLDEYLKLMPFPQYTSGTNNLNEEEIKVIKKSRNNKYRELMLSQAGIAIFLFGNKKIDNNGVSQITVSNGMYEEFKISVAKGIKPIPIGATGYTAKKIWLEVKNDFNKYFGDDKDLYKSFNVIGDQNATNEQIIQNVNSIVEILQNKY